MSSAFIKLPQDKLNAALAGVLCPRIEAILSDRGPGHCVRVTDLDDEVMESVCWELRRIWSDGNIFILGSHDQEGMPFRVTSTKLVELRNPDANGELRQPLLVFIPTSLRTSAEDSFGVATFEELTFTDIYEDLIESLFDRLPATLASYVRDLLGILTEEEWLFADDVSRVRYLLTALENGIDGETLGASLYELALIPDFKLFADPGMVIGKILRNLVSVRSLITSHKSVRGRIADLGLSDKALESRLFTYFEKHDVHESESWTPPIATDKSWWSISFDKWTFKEELSLDKVLLTVLETDLPVVADDETDDQLSGLIGQQVLVPNDRRKMNVVFEVNPHPGKVSGLDHFMVQIISQNDGPVGKSKKVKVWTPNRLQCTTSLAKLNKIEFEEGWHFIRVMPWTADGDPIPLEADSASEGAKRSYESEPFYVLPGGNIEEEPPQRAIPIEQSLEHALFRLQLTALGDERDPDDIAISGVVWSEGGRTKKTSRLETLHAKFGREGAVQIPLSRTLKIIEQRILAKPKHPSGWRMQINMDTAEPPSEAGLMLPSSAAMASFLAAREEFFAAVRKDTAELIMQGLLFQDSEEECLAYAESYLDLIRSLIRQAEMTSGVERQQHLQSLRNVLAVDSIHVILTDFRGRHREAVLVSPTHPLRALWLNSWVTLGKDWIGKIKSGGKEYIPHVRSALLDGLVPSAYPVGIPVEDGRIFTPVDNLNAFWALYAPTTEDNSRGLMAEICSALGLVEPSTAGTDISGKVIADKIERYLSQHPYVRELSLNIFNPGSGSLIAEALIALQQKREYVDLRYDIRLFTSEPDSPVLGEALESIARPGATVNEAADAFAASTGNHLFSKLNLAKHALKEFHANSKDFPAHISVLLDVFPAEELSISERPMGVTPLYGLIQGFDTEFVDDDSGTFWNKRPIIGRSFGANNHAACFDLLSSLSRHLCFATSAVATSGASFKAVPVVTLGLDVAQRELIYEVHQISDWVFTIDRNMGIEFFDHGGRKNRPDYLIDYVPGASSQATHNLMISSRSNDELEAMLKPVLLEHDLSADGEQSVQILANLRSLSGQLALKLISARTQQAEALGLALARLYLEYQGALNNQIIVPLDAHTDLYRSSGESDDVNDAISLQRTDLGLFDLDLNTRTITCNLVEVKCYSQVGAFAAFNQLKERISAQINQSERILQRHFDPALKKPDRPDRLLKSRELAQILRFYLERSLRYGIFEETAAQEARGLLESIEQGYSLQFRRCALIFDFDKSGTESPDNEVGIEFHRIGKDLIHALLENCRKPVSVESEEVLTSPTLSEQFILNVPKLETAAFIAPNRVRSTSWTVDELLVDEPETPVTQLTPPVSEETTALVQKEERAKPVEQAPKPTTIAPKQEKDDEQFAAVDVELEQGVQLELEVQKHLTPEPQAEVSYDIMLGVNGDSPQYGLLGEVSGRKIALDLNHTHTISLFGVQGGGKSYTLGTAIEMASMPIQHINVLPSPLATVIFHYSPTQDYAPEFTSMINANSVEDEICILRERYKANPEALNDVLILTPANKVDERRAEFPDIEVKPIAFSASELKAAHWKFLMGAIGSQSMYMRQINLIMRGLRDNLTLDSLRAGIDNSGLSDHLKELAQTRLLFASEYIDDNQRLQDLIRPGRLIIVDLRDEYIEKDEALGLFVVMLQVFSEATYQGSAFNKLVVFDEAHKYIENDDLVSGLVEVVREMRHKGTSIMVASQDPPSVPISLIELSSQIIMHKFNSPAWLKHIQKANAALGELTSDKMSHLGTGEAYVWSSKASDDSFTRGAVKIKCRPRITQHGGSTKTAVGR
ncbi:ATP-binding protein [Klebsiella pneumoniae subsp. pneumoniae]|uniref:methylation-associated defense system ATP-binding protein MAD8 n=1 Tax=Klebsiella pneumoniae TaxID=573 RepID=UPI001AECB3B6|nr:ATP-binding protein [Klebsiella pneumoniae]MBP2830329.1 ATP-binding protein [Klebsiella pneumoniae subsp. pneumoniae]MCC4926992.1 ATP-binding protein [Klebsiella pneumoniae]HBQ5861120.1 ATP-binding protein [Klebsiella pneumoniae subsp. pneumoniae]HBR3479262.1 ATP-binding protein [Klebsiella pneumoniae]HBS2435670.1 ATP-binding protein [Klebsiella pneumoniae]